MEIVSHGWDAEDFHERFAPIIDGMMLNRGWIINSYSQVEFLLADLILKSQQLPGYENLKDKPLPFGFDNRIAGVRDLCRTGPLAAHAETIEPLLDHFVTLEETRHFFSHGFVSIHIEKGGGRMGMHLRRYVPPKKGSPATRAELFVFPEQMEAEKARWAIFAQTTLLLIRDIYTDLKLEAHDVTDGSPEVLGVGDSIGGTSAVPPQGAAGDQPRFA